MTTRSNTRGPLGDLQGMPTVSKTVAGRASFMAEKIANRLNELDGLGGRFALRGSPRLAGRGLHRCRIPGVGDVTIRQGSSDALVFRQVFRDRQYEFSREAHTARARAAYDEIVARGIPRWSSTVAPTSAQQHCGLPTSTRKPRSSLLSRTRATQHSVGPTPLGYASTR